MTVSFDFDKTLDQQLFQKLARKHIELGHDVWVTTARFALDEQNIAVYGANWPSYFGGNEDVEFVCGLTGIPVEKIQYCGTEDKSKFLKGFDIHYDDNPDVCREINSSNCGCIAVNIRT